MLADVIEHGVTTLLCGSAAGAVSARLGLPYAGPGNKFWPMLAESGLTPRRLAPAEFRELPRYRLGLTDINKTEWGADSDLTGAGDDTDALRAKIEAYRPAILAFTAKRPALVFLRALFGARQVDYGAQEQRLGETEIHVLPSPSGLAIRWWDSSHWHALGARHRALVG
ncbi:MAG: mismatch-specific DNA-glycosylase [Defluviicoccus sp.]|nr:mismatch-specific DNA-glycosylase [Defluviicoccus sp.]MDE0384719.1 mismatch-specific DNA-glycosylase [Defluviicoccus sp.]